MAQVEEHSLVFNFGEEWEEQPANPLDTLLDEMDLGLEMITQVKAKAKPQIVAPAPRRRGRVTYLGR